MIGLSRPWLSAIALIVVFAMPASQVVVRALAQSMIECCCGPHDVDHRCGCPECPGGGQGEPGDGSSDTASFRMCGTDSPVVTAAVTLKALLEAAPAVIHRPWLRRGPPVSERPPPLPEYDAPTPPPERRA